MSRKLLVGLRTIPMILVMGTIFFISDQPGDSLHLPPLPGIDKLAHAVVYGILAAATIFSFSARYKDRASRAVLIITMIICLSYGISDELHQAFVPGRLMSGLDILADVCGALMVCLFWVSRLKYQNKEVMSS